MQVHPWKEILTEEEIITEPEQIELVHFSKEVHKEEDQAGVAEDSVWLKNKDYDTHTVQDKFTCLINKLYYKGTFFIISKNLGNDHE